jgi:hypothetical protein
VACQRSLVACATEPSEVCGEETNIVIPGSLCGCSDGPAQQVVKLASEVPGGLQGIVVSYGGNCYSFSQATPSREQLPGDILVSGPTYASCAACCNAISIEPPCCEPGGCAWFDLPPGGALATISVTGSIDVTLRACDPAALQIEGSLKEETKTLTINATKQVFVSSDCEQVIVDWGSEGRGSFVLFDPTGNGDTCANSIGGGYMRARMYVLQTYWRSTPSPSGWLRAITWGFSWEYAGTHPECVVYGPNGGQFDLQPTNCGSTISDSHSQIDHGPFNTAQCGQTIYNPCTSSGNISATISLAHGICSPARSPSPAIQRTIQSVPPDLRSSVGPIPGQQDPRIQAIIVQQMNGGGCEGCGQ